MYAVSNIGMVLQIFLHGTKLSSFNVFTYLNGIPSRDRAEGMSLVALSLVALSLVLPSIPSETPAPG